MDSAEALDLGKFAVRLLSRVECGCDGGAIAIGRKLNRIFWIQFDNKVGFLGIDSKKIGFF
jgi:hypothetical protein